MEKFLEKSEKVINFWFIRFGVAIILFCLFNLLKIDYLYIPLLISLLPESYMCYLAHRSSEEPKRTIKKYREMRLMKWQRFILWFMPFSLLMAIIFNGNLLPLTPVFSVLNIIFMFIFYRNHRTLKSLFIQ